MRHTTTKTQKGRRKRQKERETLLKSLNERKKQYNFINTATPTIEPIEPLQLWRYNRIVIMVLGTNKKLYAIKGNRRFFLKELHAPIGNMEPPDKTWTPQELYFIRIAKELNVTPEEALKLSQELDRRDEAEFINSFSEIAKERGITPQEAYEQIQEESFKEFEEFNKQIQKERMEKLIQLQKTTNHP